ncbi:MAG: cupin domain-containing protein, partial [Pseudomonadota bacterium]
MTGMPEDLAEPPNFGTDVFSEVLDIVHVRGETARVITSEGPLSVTVPAGQLCVYILEMGQLEIRVGSRPVVKLRQNQIALLLQGVDHDVQFGLSGLTTPPVGPTGPRTGGDGRETIKCFWGSFTVDGDLAARLLQSLPPVIVLDDLAEAPIEWVDTVCDLVLRELGATRPGGALMVSRLLDLLLVILLRRWAQSEDRLPDWLAAAKDQRIARAV